MVLADAIAERRSIRRYLDQPISDALLETLLSAAGWAPSAHNRQPWRFALLRSAAPKDRLARAMGVRLAADRRRDGDAETATLRDRMRASPARRSSLRSVSAWSTWTAIKTPRAPRWNA
jgi:nitroreductase